MTAVDIFSITSAIFAILMAGSGDLKLNLYLYSLQTVAIACGSVAHSLATGASHLYLVAIAILTVKAFFVPSFLSWIARKIEAHSDPGVLLPIPMGMHLAIVLLGLSNLLARTLPQPQGLIVATGGATAAISLIFTGTLFMLTRRVALSQIIGFLTIENGIYIFAVTQTSGMPLIVEMGVLLDVLVGVMISGLFIFRIKKSFEHIDVTQLDRLKEG